MERPKYPYSINSRPTRKRNRRIYYVVFRDEAGNSQTAVSTGCTRRDVELPRPYWDPHSHYDSREWTASGNMQ